jgi:uncharacterized protein YbjT (DUF2867 family)
MSNSGRPRPPQPTADEPIAVVGATGEQGGAVARTLLARGTPVRAIVRDPQAERARALAAAGARLVTADLMVESSLRAAFDGASAVFAMASPTPDGGVQAESEHGTTIARAAAAVAVPHVVYSSVGGVDRDSGIPHFESKLEIEQALLDLGVPCTFIRPVFFMDNFVRFMAPTEEDGVIVVRLPMPGDVALQMIAVVDVATVAVVALLEPDRIAHGAIEIAGDELTGEQIAATFGELRGLPARFEQLPTTVLDEDNKAMFEWFANPPAYQADIEATRALDPEALTFAQWLATVN